MKNILLMEPFYQGSHKYWVDLLKQKTKHRMTVALQRGVKWKRRVQESSYEFELADNHDFDIILSTNMMNLAAWAGINRSKIGSAKLVHYFHENQLTYPQADKATKMIFGQIDLNSAICADHVVFNSQYHLEQFIGALEKLNIKLKKKFPHNLVKQIRLKSLVLPIGLELDKLQDNKVVKNNVIPHILWNHRWEQDKNPELFFKTLIKLKHEKVEFKLNMLGSPPKRIPSYIEEAKLELSENIVQWGRVQSRQEYIEHLWSSDILPVTSFHDFYGISVLEAAFCENALLLPEANAYPEHFPPNKFPQIYYQSESEFQEKLRNLIQKKDRENEILSVGEQFSWDTIIRKYDNFFDSLG